MRTPASVRLLRSALVASLILCLGVGGHIAGGDELPQPMVVAAVCALPLLPVLVLSRHRFSVPVLIGLLGGAQGWLHWGFEALDYGIAPPSVRALAVTAHSGHLSAFGPDTATAMVMPSHGGGGWGMFTAHVGATLVTVLLLARGEDAVRLLGAWLQPLVRLPGPITLPSTIRLRRLADVVLSPAAPSLTLPSRRGPRPFLRPPEHPAFHPKQGLFVQSERGLYSRTCDQDRLKRPFIGASHAAPFPRSFPFPSVL